MIKRLLATQITFAVHYRFKQAIFRNTLRLLRSWCSLVT